MNPHQIDDLRTLAAAADADERQRDAAFLYERARGLAQEQADAVLAYSLGVRAARSWMFTGEDDRALANLLDTLTDIPFGADPVDVYIAQGLRFNFYLEGPRASNAAVHAAMEALHEVCSELNPQGPEISYYEGRLLERSGRYAEAYSKYEIAWSRRQRNRLGISTIDIATHAASIAIRLDELTEAERWIGHVEERGTLQAQLKSSFARLLLGMRRRDAVAVRTALTDTDEAMAGVQRPRYTANVIAAAVPALCLDPAYGDPQNSGHPAARRLEDFPAQERYGLFGHWSWCRAALSYRLAALRYAAGMPPDEDYFGRPPHLDPASFSARILAEVPVRAATARNACDEAMVIAREIDTECEGDINEREMLNLRDRVEQIAAVHGVRFPS